MNGSSKGATVKRIEEVERSEIYYIVVECGRYRIKNNDHTILILKKG